jgi:hypothetical protein
MRNEDPTMTKKVIRVLITLLIALSDIHSRISLSS